MKEVLWRRYEKFFRRLHKNIGHIHFLTECSEKYINPKFTWILVQTVKQLNLNPSQIKTHRREHCRQTEHIYLVENKIKKISSSDQFILSFFSDY